MNYFITGATGFFGTEVLKKMVKEYPNDTMNVLVHKSPMRVSAPNIQTFNGSLVETNLSPFLNNVHTIIHIAGTTHASTREAYEIGNQKATEQLVTAAKVANVRRIVFISTRCIGNACGLYGQSKLMAEDIIKKSGIPYVILRLSEVYSSSGTEGINMLISAVKRFLVLPYLPNKTINFAPLFIDDAATAVIAILKNYSLQKKTYTIAGAQNYTMKQLLEAVANAMGKTRFFIPIPLSVVRLVIKAGAFIGLSIIKSDQVDRLTCEKDSSILPAVTDLNFAPISFAEGLLRIRQ